MAQPLPVAGKLPIKTSVARQLPTNTHTYTYIHIHIHTHIHTYISTTIYSYVRIYDLYAGLTLACSNYRDVGFLTTITDFQLFFFHFCIDNRQIIYVHYMDCCYVWYFTEESEFRRMCWQCIPGSQFPLPAKMKSKPRIKVRSTCCFDCQLTYFALTLRGNGNWKQKDETENWNAIPSWKQLAPTTLVSVRLQSQCSLKAKIWLDKDLAAGCINDVSSSLCKIIPHIRNRE